MVEVRMEHWSGGCLRACRPCCAASAASCRRVEETAGLAGARGSTNSGTARPAADDELVSDSARPCQPGYVSVVQSADALGLHLAASPGRGGCVGATSLAATGDGPSRFLAIVFSVIVGILFRRAVRELGVLIAVVALTLSLWCAFETVIAPYYVWPTIAVALIGLSATSRSRTAATLVFALLANLASNADLHAEWVWWVIVSALAALLAASWPQARARSSGPAAVEAPCCVGMAVVGARPLTNSDR